MTSSTLPRTSKTYKGKIIKSCLNDIHVHKKPNKDKDQPMTFGKAHDSCVVVKHAYLVPNPPLHQGQRQNQNTCYQKL